MPCELNTCVCAWIIFFESYVARPYLNGWVASTSAADTAHAFVKLANYVYVYEREIYQSAICNVHRTDQLDPLLHCVLRIVNRLFAHCKNHVSYFIPVALTLTNNIQAYSQ